MGEKDLGGTEGQETRGEVKLSPGDKSGLKAEGSWGTKMAGLGEDTNVDWASMMVVKEFGKWRLRFG